MPLKFEAKIGSNFFSLDGDFTFDASVTEAFRLWLGTKLDPNAAAIAKLADDSSKLGNAVGKLEDAGTKLDSIQS